MTSRSSVGLTSVADEGRPLLLTRENDSRSRAEFRLRMLLVADEGLPPLLTRKTDSLLPAGSLLRMLLRSVSELVSPYGEEYALSRIPLCTYLRISLSLSVSPIDGSIDSCPSQGLVPP